MVIISVLRAKSLLFPLCSPLGTLSSRTLANLELMNLRGVHLVQLDKCRFSLRGVARWVASQEDVAVDFREEAANAFKQIDM